MEDAKEVAVEVAVARADGGRPEVKKTQRVVGWSRRAGDTNRN